MHLAFDAHDSCADESLASRKRDRSASVHRDRRRFVNGVHHDAIAARLMCGSDEFKRASPMITLHHEIDIAHTNACRHSDAFLFASELKCTSAIRNTHRDAVANQCEAGTVEQKNRAVDAQILRKRGSFRDISDCKAPQPRRINVRRISGDLERGAESVLPRNASRMRGRKHTRRMVIERFGVSRVHERVHRVA